MSAEKFYPTDSAGELDADVGSSRVRLCTKRTWCTRDEGHTGNCEEIPRQPYERQDWDKRIPDPRGWTDAAKKRSL